MLLFALVAAPMLAHGAANTPMNSRPYTISPTSAAKNNPTAKAPAFRGEFFEMYGHWQNTTYSEVDWHADPVPLPAEIVKRFDGKGLVLPRQAILVWWEKRSRALTSREFFRPKPARTPAEPPTRTSSRTSSSPTRTRAVLR